MAYTRQAGDAKPLCLRAERINMGVYEVVYEIAKSDGTLVDQVHYVEAPDFLSVAKDSAQHAEGYEHDLKRIRYLFNIVKRISNEDA